MCILSRLLLCVYYCDGISITITFINSTLSLYRKLILQDNIIKWIGNIHILFYFVHRIS